MTIFRPTDLAPKMWRHAVKAMTRVDYQLLLCGGCGAEVSTRSGLLTFIVLDHFNECFKLQVLTRTICLDRLTERENATAALEAAIQSYNFSQKEADDLDRLRKRLEEATRE